MIHIIILSFLLISYFLYQKLLKKKNKPFILFEKNEKIVFPDKKQSIIGIKNQLLKNKLSKQPQPEHIFLDDDYMDLLKKRFASENRKEKDEFKEFHEYNTSGLNFRFVSQSFEDESSYMKKQFQVDKFENMESKYTF